MKRILIVLFAFVMSTFSVNADEIKFVCYQDSNECEVIAEMATMWESSSGHTVNIETVGYQVVREQLENLLESDAAPDVARVTNLGGLNKFYLEQAFNKI